MSVSPQGLTSFQLTERGSPARRLSPEAAQPQPTAAHTFHPWAHCRAYKAEDRLTESNGKLIDRNVVMTLVQMSCNR